MRTLSQERAEFALKRVLAIPDSQRERFKPFSAGAPSMILQNGFGQALAFWIAKGKANGKNEYISMFNIVNAWLCNKNFASGNNAAEFIENLAEMEQSDYLTAQKETLALLEWVKRYANAELWDSAHDNPELHPEL